MAFHARDKTKRAEESVPLTSDQDEPSFSSSKEPSNGGPLPPPWQTAPGAQMVEEAAPSHAALRSVNTEPVISRDSSLELREENGNVTRLSFLHDEVEKMFEPEWKCDIDSLTTDPNTRDPTASKMCRESSKLALSEFYHVDEAEFSRHRRVSYPHIHQPLRSLSNKSLSKSNKAHREKRKHRKKKKKEKIRSFPSQNAIKSPTIVEEEENHADQDYYMSGSSSVSDEEEFEDEFDEQDLALPVSTVSFKPEPSASEGDTPSFNIIPATPSEEKLLGDFPEGTSSATSIPAEISPEESPQKKQTVDFYIGGAEDLASPSSEKLVLLGEEDEAAVLFIEEKGDDDSASKELDEGEKEQHQPWLSSLISDSSQPGGEGEGKDLLELSEVRPGWSLEPQVAERPARLVTDVPEVHYKQGGRKASYTGGKVTFVVGEIDEAGSANLGRRGSTRSTGGGEQDGKQEEEGAGDEEGEEVWKKHHKRGSSKRRGSSEADVHSGQDHALLRVSSVEGSQSTKSTSRRKHHHHQHFKQEDLIMRRQKGSEVQLGETHGKAATEQDEANMLYRSDLEQMTSHRFEDQRGIRRHKIARSKGALHSIVHIGKTHQEKKPRVTKKFDHSPHEVFVELDELHFGGEDLWEWREKARWIKFEEDVEEGAERWGKPHVASLSFHSLLELRRGLEKGTLLLDLEATDLTSIIHSVVENMVIRDLVEEEVKGQLLRTLLLKHKHQKEQEKSLLASFSQSSLGSTLGLNKSPSQASVEHARRRSSAAHAQSLTGQAAKLEMVKVDLDNNMTDKQADGIHIGITPVEQKKHVQDIMRRIPKGSEASTVLVGKVDFLKKPAMAFVRLAEGQYLDNLTEVPLPVRFLFILLGPDSHGSMDYHEVGRSLSTLMSNQAFHEVAYRAESREDLLRAINSFLDDSIVLPPGDWDHRTLLPITHMARKRAQIRRQKQQRMEEQEALLEKQEKEDIPMDPLKRTGCLFGGVINDIRRRYPWYLSDITDAFNGQCIKTLFFIFFTCLAPCIAFGGLLSEKTHGLMGMSETMLGTSLFGMIFSVFCGQPLLIIGSTGPVLVFEEALFKVCENQGIEFLVLRFWTGLWVCAITVVAVALEGSFLVRYVTRFTEEIFAILISLIFIYEVVKKLMHIFAAHPLMSDYCDSDMLGNLTNSSLLTEVTKRWSGEGQGPEVMHHPGHEEDSYHVQGDHKLNQPNTALLSLILVFGTFLIAYFLRVFRNSKFLGRGVRRALGDFGVLISLACMMVLSTLMSKTYVQKLNIATPLTPTIDDRGWFVNPLGRKQDMPAWVPFAAILPALLIFIVLFMETQITEMFINKKERRLHKGSGYHVDQLILGGVTFLGGLLGMPWMCAAAVRTVAHVSALTCYSRTHAPGEKPVLLGVKEQRVTNFCVHLLIGLSVTLGPVLKEIPVAALFGIFLYLGVSTLNGVQMFERIKLLLMPVKYHPSVSYVRKVPTKKMHMFTLIQLALLIFMLLVKSSFAAVSFPLWLLLVVPLRRKIVTRFFTSAELEHLDKEEEEFELDDEDDPDFYQQAHMPI